MSVLGGGGGGGGVIKKYKMNNFKEKKVCMWCCKCKMKNFKQKKGVCVGGIIRSIK